MTGFEITSLERRPGLDCLGGGTGLRLPPLRGAHGCTVCGASQRLIVFWHFLVFWFLFLRCVARHSLGLA